MSLRERVGLSRQQRFRLVGVGLNNFHNPPGCICAARSFLAVVVSFRFAVIRTGILGREV